MTDAPKPPPSGFRLVNGLYVPETVAAASPFDKTVSGFAPPEKP